jgi:hypothetical protein
MLNISVALAISIAVNKGNNSPTQTLIHPHDPTVLTFPEGSQHQQ